VVKRAALLKSEAALSGVVDEYIFIRNAYLQHREYEINRINSGKVTTTVGVITPSSHGLQGVSLPEPPE
jgi:ABC-type transporter lipoprotein component MlaA